MPHLAAPALLTDPRVRAAYAEGAGIYRVLPSAVALPASVAELEHLVQWAVRTATPLVPRGAGSGMPGGNVGSGVIVDCTAGFTGLTVDPKARLARAGAGVTWRAITEAARPFGLRLPPDPSSGAFATSGGMVATNAAGPRTVRYGAVRRWVESVCIVEVGGESRTLSRGGGAGGPWRPIAEAVRAAAGRYPKTRKNSSGYALDAYDQSQDELDLLIGSEGTLAFITEVTWRLDPIPPAAAGVALGFSDLEALAVAVPFLISLDPSAVELLDRTLLSFLGNAAHVPQGLACMLLVEFERETAAAARGAVGDAVRGVGGAPSTSKRRLTPRGWSGSGRYAGWRARRWPGSPRPADPCRSSKTAACPSIASQNTSRGSEPPPPDRASRSPSSVMPGTATSM